MIVNNSYKAEILKVILRLYAKHANSQFIDITNCQFLLNNSDALASTLINILKNEEEPLIAYQIAYDLVDNQNAFYLKEIVEIIKRIGEEHKVDEKKISTLTNILEGNNSRQIIQETLNKLNKSDPNILKNMMKAVEKGGSVSHLAVIIANSFFNSHTQNDSFLKDNLEWCGKATNWARFTASASMGAIHMGNTTKGYDVIKSYLPGQSVVPSLYAQAGAYYALGLTYANTNDQNILDKLLNDLVMPSNSKDCFQHGIYLAIGLVAMATHNMTLYERLRDGMYSDDAIIGEAAAYAIGLVLIGSKNSQAIEDLVTYAHDTQHEKIIRAIAIALSLIVYGSEESADSLIEQLSREKDPILRYGAMYSIGLAYAGTGNSNALKKLIKFSVTDVSDDVRRAALINIGFLQIRDPSILLENIKVLSLLSESYNSHVRYGVAMALGISCAGTANVNALNVLQQLLVDPNYLVRQSALLAISMIFSQTTVSQEPKLSNFKETMDKIVNDKEEHTLIRFGAIIGQGIMEIGGRNCTISLVSNSGNNRMGSIVGMALFTQYYYWFPMIHFLNLAVHPTILYGVDSNMKLDKNFKILSKAKPSVFGYPKEVKIQEKATFQKTQAAVLSTHSRVKAKTKRTQTFTSLQPAESQVLADKPKEEDEKPTEEKEKVVEEVPEPEEEILSNPCRIVPRQISVIKHMENNDYVPLLGKRFNGFVMLKKTNLNLKPEYFGEDNIAVQEKPTETNKPQEAAYQPVPTEDVEMPEDIEIENLK